MLIFEKIEYVNFMSVGSAPVTLELNKVKSSAIVGANGCGKSTLLDALCFSLFGSAYRNINKNQLINSVNGKACKVTIWFSIGKRKYKVVRGIKPNIFEIWCDDVLMNKNAALKDYQKTLEQQILKFNKKTFCQVVIIGSSAFVPFMRLSAGQRREVIDELLDIRVFTVMGSLLKDKISSTKESIAEITRDLKIAQDRVKTQQKSIKLVSNNRKVRVESLTEKIEYQQREVDKLTKLKQNLSAEIESLLPQLDDYDELHKNIQKLQRILSRKQAKISHLNETIEFFETSEVCSQCEQGIEHDHKQAIVGKLTDERGKYESEIDIGAQTDEKLNQRLERLNTVRSEIQQKQMEMKTLQASINVHTSTIDELNSELSGIKADTADLEAEKEVLRKIANDALKLVEQKKQLEQVRQIQDVSNVLLKDSGIKTAIIREYLPIMNKLINKYLGHLDAYIKFELDENFNEAIKSRHRDEFTYESFSDGEKLRVDLGLLFAWRSIARMKNSISTNLLFLDEIDRSLDTAGTELMISMIGSVEENTNVFCISHKPDIQSSFDQVIKFEKVGDFSRIVVED